MRIFSTLALTVVALAVWSSPGSMVLAQDYTSGYGFGLGFNIGRNTGQFTGNRGFHRGFHRFGNFGPTPRLEEPPYFAKFPPVYYSNIVRRPYGVSPFAAPPGIPPVELSMPQPVTISNPFFSSPESTPAKTEKSNPAKQAEGDAVTANQWIDNPHTHVAPAIVVGK